MYGEVINKDWKKGSKEASKAIKKLESISKETIQILMDKTATRTANTDYLNGYFDKCRQEIARIA